MALQALSRTDADPAIIRHIASRTGTSTAALQRHKDHLPEQLSKTHEAKELVRSGSLMADVAMAHDRSERLYCSAEEILERALESQDLKTALQAVRCAVDVMGEARNYLQLRGQLTGELKEDGVTPVTVIIGMPQGSTPPPISVGGQFGFSSRVTAVDAQSPEQPTEIAPGAVVVDVRR
jgi:hypothetical protein